MCLFTYLFTQQSIYFFVCFNALFKADFGNVNENAAFLLFSSP